MQLEAILTRLRARVLADQQANGSFLTYLSQDFTRSRGKAVTTVFINAIISTCLSSDPTEQVRLTNQRCTTFLMSQRSAQWTWNYWPRSSPESTARPYPDDLDDTVCALIAIYQSQPECITGEALACLITVLTTQETVPGGPYKTWINAPKQQAWQDVDPVVNANIATCLRDHGVTLEPLTTYLSEASTHPTPSRFYENKLVAGYFMSRALPGQPLSYIDDYVATTSFEAALLLNCTITARADRIVCSQRAEQLVALIETQGTPATGMWIDQIVQGKPVYAGSASLSAALCLEALNRYQAYVSEPEIPEPQQDEPSLFWHTHSLVDSLSPELATPLNHYIAKVAVSNRRTPIYSLAHTVAAAYEVQLDQDLLDQLGTATVLGWVSYTLLDDILDRSSEIANHPAAAWSARTMYQLFSAALPYSSAYSDSLSRILTLTDSANAWEAAHCRIPPLGEAVLIDPLALPDYGDLANLAHRSLGHALAGLAILYLTNNQLDAAALERFFFHFLLARQLNDDAHDWQADLTQGLLSPVVCQLIRDAYGDTLPIAVPKADYTHSLQKSFSETQLIRICSDVRQHLQHAEAALRDCAGLKNPQYLTDLLKPLYRSIEAAEAEHKKTTDFLSAYQGEPA